MKLLTVVSMVSTLGFLAGCGVSGGSSAPAGIQVDQNTPVVTTGAQCATAAQAEFKAPGKRVGASEVQPGTYAYVESRHLYIGENNVDGAMVEGHVSDSVTSTGDKDYSLAVDCQNAKGLKTEKNYSDDLRPHFALKIVINKGGDRSETDRRDIFVTENQGKFSVVGTVDTSTNVTLNDELKIRDSKYSTTANKKYEYWQRSNGDLYIVMHSGVNVSSTKNGASSVTRDSIVHYKRSAPSK